MCDDFEVWMLLIDSSVVADIWQMTDAAAMPHNNMILIVITHTSSIPRSEICIKLAACWDASISVCPAPAGCFLGGCACVLFCTSTINTYNAGFFCFREFS